mmetsp:Transcript_7634/g.14951  ORF Transcript_7634/g.14951 Transcript_7634/m.14951 type:complete len:81 (-) Transcript_7634:8-250(-)
MSGGNPLMYRIDLWCVWRIYLYKAIILQMEHFEAKDLRYLAISPHIAGVAVAAEAKGGIHRNADAVYKDGVHRLRASRRK